MRDWQTTETRKLGASVRQAGFADLPAGPCRFRLTAEHADGETAVTTFGRTVVAGTRPSARVASVQGQTVLFEVSGISDYTISFEKQSNALAGSYARSGSAVTYSFSKEVAALGTHWLTLYVKDASGTTVAKATHVTNPPADHPLLADFERDYLAAVERASAEGKLVLTVISGEPDGRKFKNISGMLASNEVLRAVANGFVVTEAIATTREGDRLARRLWRAQPTSPSQATAALYQPEINAYAVVVDPNRPDRPYPCAALPPSYFSDASRWNYLNSQLDLANLGYDFYVASRTADLVRFLGQTGLATTAAAALAADGETPYRPSEASAAVFVPNEWLVAKGLAVAGRTTADGARAALAARYANGMTGWESFVAGLDPQDSDSVLRAAIELVDGEPVVRWSPDLTGTDEQTRRPRRYVVQGKDALDSREWRPYDPRQKFFRVVVDLMP